MVLSKKADPGSVMATQKLGQGRDAVKLLIKDNPELAEELESKIIEAINKNRTSRLI